MALACPGCQAALPAWLVRRRIGDSTCPQCFRNFQIELFPAIFRKAAESVAPASLVIGEAACYEHSTRPAKASCRQCGRFVCALCEVEMGGATWCPVCLHSPHLAGAGQALEKGRTNYDSIALALATWPMAVFVYPSFLTAPVVIYIVLRYWRKPLSLIPRNRWRFVVALVISLVQIALLAALIAAIIIGVSRQRRTGL